MSSWRAWELPPGSAWGIVCSAPSTTMWPTPSCNYASSVPSTSTLWYFSLLHTLPHTETFSALYIPEPVLMKGELNECFNTLHQTYLAAEQVVRPCFPVDLRLALPQAQHSPLACMQCLHSCHVLDALSAQKGDVLSHLVSCIAAQCRCISMLPTNM